MTTNAELLEMLRGRLETLDEERERVNQVIADLEGGERAGRAKHRTTERTATKTTKGKSAIGIAQWKRRYKEAMAAGNKAKANEFRDKLRATRDGRTALREAATERPKTAKKRKAKSSAKAATATE